MTRKQRIHLCTEIAELLFKNHDEAIISEETTLYLKLSGEGLPLPRILPPLATKNPEGLFIDELTATEQDALDGRGVEITLSRHMENGDTVRIDTLDLVDADDELLTKIYNAAMRHTPDDANRNAEDLKKEYTELTRRTRNLEARIIRTATGLLKKIIPEGHMLPINRWGHNQYIDDGATAVTDNALSAPYPEYKTWNPYAVRHRNGLIEVSLAETEDDEKDTWIPLEDCGTFGAFSATQILDRVMMLRDGNNSDNMKFELKKI